MIHSNYEIGFKCVKENVLGREFQGNHKNYSATFKRKVTGIKSHENSKIKILCEFKVPKCFKEEKSF